MIRGQDTPPEQAITNELNKNYANRVLHDVGLCVCVFDLSEVGEGKVRYGDGFYWYKGLWSFFSASNSVYVDLGVVSRFPAGSLSTLHLRGDSCKSEIV